MTRWLRSRREPPSRACLVTVAVSLALCAVTAACSAPPVTSRALPPSPPGGASASVSASAPGSASGTAAPVEELSHTVLAERVADAYEQRARGDLAQARAGFDDVVKHLVAAGEKPAAGLGDLDGYVVRGRTKAGFTKRARGGNDTWFFDIETGEPFAFVPGMGLRRGAPALDGSYFVTMGSEGLFNPALATYTELPGALLAVHPDGHRAYVLGDNCRIQEIGLERLTLTRALAAHSVKGRGPQAPHPECDADGFRDAAITADGKWLSTRFGRWNLGSGAHRPLPFGWTQAGYAPAISPDGRYVARVAPNPAATKDNLTTAMVLTLHDLDTGAVKTAAETLSALSNGDPLSFGADPARVCIVDHGFYAYEVPSLRKYEAGDSALAPEAGPLNFGPYSCETKFVRPPPEHPALAARLAARVCTVGGFLLPVEHCAKPGQ